MEDDALLSLFRERSETAITETDAKYGRTLRGIANEMLQNRQDAEEIVNDVLLTAWNAIPPEEPRSLFGYLTAVTRNLSMHRVEKRFAQRRGGGQRPAVLDELAECVSAAETVDSEIDKRLLKEVLQRFLDRLPKEQRILFVLRYYYAMPVKEIAQRRALSESKVKVTLLRVRTRLAEYLKKEGWM